MSTDWTTLSDEELTKAPQEIYAEQQRRNVVNNAQQMILDTNKAYLNGVGQLPGTDWVQPTGAHDSYPMDWIVTHNNKAWESLANGNVWEPGVSGWREYALPGEDFPAWVQPTGAHDAYDLGDKVSHNARGWTSAVYANTWEPGTPGTESLWIETIEGPDEPPPADEWPAWKQPTGAQDDYDQGAKVSHADKHWTSDINGNVWEPGVYGWTSVV